MTPTVFISYAREDQLAAIRLYHDLKRAGVEPWLDVFSLLPGQNWRVAIQKAIRTCRYFVALISSHSLNRRGFIHSETSEALRILEEYADSEIFVIPARLESCEVSHERLLDLHRVDLFPSWDDGVAAICRVLLPSNAAAPVREVAPSLSVIVEKYVQNRSDETEGVDIFFSLRNVGSERLVVYDVGLAAVELSASSRAHAHFSATRVRLAVILRQDILRPVTLIDESCHSIAQTLHRATNDATSFMSAVIDDTVITLDRDETQSFVVALLASPECTNVRARFCIGAAFHGSTGVRHTAVSNTRLDVLFPANGEPPEIAVSDEGGAA